MCTPYRYTTAIGVYRQLMSYAQMYRLTGDDCFRYAHSRDCKKLRGHAALGFRIFEARRKKRKKCYHAIISLFRSARFFRFGTEDKTKKMSGVAVYSPTAGMRKNFRKFRAFRTVISSENILIALLFIFRTLSFRI